MRTSYSPTRGRKTPLPPRPLISLCIVTHYEKIDWYKELPEVTKLSMDSMLAGARDYELIIWDNGSPQEYIDILEGYKPDILIRSYNVGNWNARRAMLKMARADIVNLADCDLLYSTDWMDKQVKILKTYPNVGLVHGSPNKVTDRDLITQEWAIKNGGVAELIPQDWEDDYCISRHMFGGRLDGDACLVKYKDVSAWVCSRDMQIVCYRDTIEPFYAHQSENIFDRSGLCRRIGESGLYMFSTQDRTAIHIGNRIDDTIRKALTNLT